jgi:hypothetical protein
MGSWGTGLYSSDFARDLRPLIAAVARLPFEPDRLIEILCETEPTAAERTDDPDHSIFWLTLADQFAKRRIDCRTARERALAIIDDGTDLAIMTQLGMAEKDLAKRRKMLSELRDRLAAPVPEKPRVVLKAPQPLLMQPGEALAYPMSSGHCINPYLASKDRMRPLFRLSRLVSAHRYGTSLCGKTRTGRVNGSAHLVPRARRDLLEEPLPADGIVSNRQRGA